MPDDSMPLPELRFADQIDYYDTTDFGLLAAEVTNDAWVGTGDVMATLRLLRSDGNADDVYVPVQVDNGPVTRGTRVTFPIENVTKTTHGETRINLIELSGGQPTGAYEWTVWYAPIRNPFDE
jgi:hypothetical protein